MVIFSGRWGTSLSFVCVYVSLWGFVVGTSYSFVFCTEIVELVFPVFTFGVAMIRFLMCLFGASRIVRFWVFGCWDLAGVLVAHYGLEFNFLFVLV